MIDSALVTTVTEIPNYRVAKNFGIVRGIVVRSRSIVGNIGATLQTLLGGNITIYTELCEKARADAHRLMVEHGNPRSEERSQVTCRWAEEGRHQFRCNSAG